MPSTPDASYADPRFLRIDVDASEGLVSMGTRLLHTLPSFHGSIYLRPAGSLAGFALSFPLPLPYREEPPELVWEAVELPASRLPQEVSGQSSLRLGRRRAFARVSALCAEVPGGRSGRPYLKIVLEARLPSLALRWPSATWHRLRPARLRLFTEIRPEPTGTSLA
ncbi:hypothetical protein E1292_48755 [Nonomuraea deserti]|uniref:Uncharacterized protein n=1 Tax=Nonomuraea deserti TaxID=1848322 RepID=A0A4V2Y5T6_9ACTN|nr:hypothetical protein [Nonomuraea deserti]TDC85575.1 hypothetical protein E1292_48755 [Nonomuraea deserti]